ncbi:hypothetical protein SOPP22_15985 [Shewanella sp. OPT22]|nr:hypothetical protein SOPP22_15985 [Shewanella sp. OPT22]
MKFVKSLASSLCLASLIFLSAGAQATSIITATGSGTSDSPYRIEIPKDLKFSPQQESLNPVLLPDVSKNTKNVYVIIHVPEGISTKIESMSIASTQVLLDDGNIMYGEFTGDNSDANAYPAKGSVKLHISNQCVGEIAGTGQTCEIVNHSPFNKDGSFTTYPLKSGYYKMNFAISKTLPDSILIGAAFRALSNQANNFNEK